MLKKYLCNKILSDGKMTFEEFMSEALYNEPLGYYSSGRTKIGKKGDFFTSPSVHRIFGELVCRQIVEMWQTSGGGDFVIVEMGAGDGTLAHDILLFAMKEHPSFFERLKYIIVEKSRSLKNLQRKTIKEEGLLNKALWADQSDPIFTNGITGCFLSNELIDSFPVHVVLQKEGELKEVFVACEDDSLREVIDSPSSTALIEYFERAGIELEEGQRAEVNLQALDWIKWVAKSLKKGYVMTIDYGYPAEELYAPHRKDGTLLCYHRHSVVENPYQNIGEQDMTAHVDFTSLMTAGEENGLKTVGMTDQMHFLFNLGIAERIEEMSLAAGGESEALQERLMIKNLIMPGRLGNIFKVLIQYKGFESAPGLSGLTNIFRQ